VIDLNLLSNNDREIELSDKSSVALEQDTSDDIHSIQIWQDAIDKEPLNYWLWRDLCRGYASMNNLDGAILACQLGIKKSRANPSPLMELTNLYAAKGDYKAAIITGMQLIKFKPIILRLALKDSKDSLNTPNSPKIKLKSSLEQ
jgi:tetratricopeptide (TPR) repeat protein